VEIVLGVRLQPADVRPTIYQGVMVNRPETDSGARRNRPSPHTSVFEA
jgi:hypothetical protein